MYLLKWPIVILFICNYLVFNYGLDSLLEHEKNSRILRMNGEIRQKRNARVGRKNVKLQKLRKAVKDIYKKTIPIGFKPEEWSETHKYDTKTVILAAAIPAGGVRLSPLHIDCFAGTARKVGFGGDIVVAIRHQNEQKDETFLKTLVQYKVVVYDLHNSTKCAQFGVDTRCSVYDMSDYYSVNVIRYFLYGWWASMYSSEALIMIADLRDVFFQSNPFVYRTNEWMPPAAQLVVFQEPHPNSVINRCPHNSNWVLGCYGAAALKKIGHNTVICSGVTMGTRDALLVYSDMMTQQLDPNVRFPTNSSRSGSGECLSCGIDQGFHNWLIYSGILEKYMDIRVFAQGEGPVNTIGAFSGDNKVVKFTLEKWGILRGGPSNGYIVNWNGDRSPVVHQMDRFSAYRDYNMEAMRGV